MSAEARRECARCVLRIEDDPVLEFDAAGVCRYCRHYDAVVGRAGERKAAADPERTWAEIREAGKGKRYDCVVGLSGGVDSSYVLLLARKAGLRTLAVHLDNGWNSELAVRNIENLVKRLGADLHTHVISWGEFRDLQVSYFRASVVDIEALTDHAILACLYRTAAAHGIRHVLTGINDRTEGFLPMHWVHAKNDLVNIRSIHRAHGSVPMRTFPTLGVLRKAWYERVRGIRMVAILDIVPYVKEEAKAALVREVDWRDYGGKHFESVFMRFYQAYILPGKFGIDKRRSHFSSLICAGQMTREAALAELAKPPCDPAQLAVDREFVMKKLGFDEAAFEAYMKAPARSHFEYASHLKARLRLSRIYRKFRPRRG
jgi:N-acetyl sugar amidotransferase